MSFLDEIGELLDEALAKRESKCATTGLYRWDDRYDVPGGGIFSANPHAYLCAHCGGWHLPAEDVSK